MDTWGRGRRRGLTCTHDPLHPRIPQAALHVLQALDVPVGKHRDGHGLPAGEQGALSRGDRGPPSGQHPAPTYPGRLEAPPHSPHCPDVLPGRGAGQRPLLLLGASVHRQQLGHSRAGSQSLPPRPRLGSPRGRLTPCGATSVQVRSLVPVKVTVTPVAPRVSSPGTHLGAGPLASHLAASLLQHLGVPHRLVNLWEDPDLARDRDRKLLVGPLNCGGRGF